MALRPQACMQYAWRRVAKRGEAWRSVAKPRGACQEEGRIMWRVLMAEAGLWGLCCPRVVLTRGRVGAWGVRECGTRRQEETQRPLCSPSRDLSRSCMYSRRIRPQPWRTARPVWPVRIASPYRVCSRCGSLPLDAGVEPLDAHVHVTRRKGR